MVIGTHGWAGSRSGPRRAVGLSSNAAAPSWDSRGFGESGEANVGAPGFEVEDARALIDYLAAPEVLLDGPAPGPHHRVHLVLDARTGPYAVDLTATPMFPVSRQPVPIS